MTLAAQLIFVISPASAGGISRPWCEKLLHFHFRIFNLSKVYKRQLTQDSYFRKMKATMWKRWQHLFTRTTALG